MGDHRVDSNSPGSMEEILCVPEEIQQEHNPRLERIERPVEEYDGCEEEMEHHDDSGADSDWIYGGDTDLMYDTDTDTDEQYATDDDSTDDHASDLKEWHEDDGRLLPYTGRPFPLQPQPFCAAGANCTIEKAQRIAHSVLERDLELFDVWVEMSNDNIHPLPVMPLQTLPNVTKACVSGHWCYHREYWTDNTAATAPAHPYFSPCKMMQVFSLRLSRTFDYPVQIYGTFAVRDCWEPLCNYVFNCTIDEPATILPGCSSLPLCSPCRGIYVLQFVLFDIDLWIKEEGETSYKQLFRGYLEFDAVLSEPKSKEYGRIPGDCYGLDMCYGFLNDGIETAIEVLVDGKYSGNVKISAFTGGFDDEVVLYDGTFRGTRVVRHFIAVDKEEALIVVLQLPGLEYRFPFKAGVGLIAAPDSTFSCFNELAVKAEFRTHGIRGETHCSFHIQPDISVDMEELHGAVAEEEQNGPALDALNMEVKRRRLCAEGENTPPVTSTIDDLHLMDFGTHGNMGASN